MEACILNRLRAFLSQTMLEGAAPLAGGLLEIYATFDAATSPDGLVFPGRPMGRDAIARMGDQTVAVRQARDCRKSESPLSRSHVGDDNILVSTDYPHHDSLFPNAINTFLSQEDIPDESKRKILWDNPARLFGL